MALRWRWSKAAMLLGLAPLSARLVAQAQISPPVTARAVVVELFTSEGCSSCPPADALLQQINGRRLPSGAAIIGLSEHVTYWNHLGWSDPFSSERFTERQTAYGRRFGTAPIYTPQMVIDGTREAVGSDSVAVTRALQAAAAAEQAEPAISLQIRSAVVSDKALLITWSVSAAGDIPRRADVYAAIADDTQRSQVNRGENSGRTLTHIAVVRSLTRLASLQTGDALTARLPVPADSSVGHHVILFAQQSGPGRILAADTHPIERLDRTTGATVQAPTTSPSR